MASAIGKPKMRGPKGAVKKGEVIEIKSLIKHPMETGLRKNKETGAFIPAHFIDSVVVAYGGKDILTVNWTGAVSKDPFFSFFVRAEASGPLKMTWRDNKGQTFEKSIKITVA